MLHSFLYYWDSLKYFYRRRSPGLLQFLSLAPISVCHVSHDPVYNFQMPQECWMGVFFPEFWIKYKICYFKHIKINNSQLKSVVDVTVLNKGCWPSSEPSHLESSHKQLQHLDFLVTETHLLSTSPNASLKLPLASLSAKLSIPQKDHEHYIKKQWCWDQTCALNLFLFKGIVQITHSLCYL